MKMFCIYDTKTRQRFGHLVADISRIRFANLRYYGDRKPFASVIFEKLDGSSVGYKIKNREILLTEEVNLDNETEQKQVPGRTGQAGAKENPAPECQAEETGEIQININLNRIIASQKYEIQGAEIIRLRTAEKFLELIDKYIVMGTARGMLDTWKRLNKDIKEGRICPT